jgi:hypothetical protein
VDYNDIESNNMGIKDMESINPSHANEIMAVCARLSIGGVLFLK